MSASVSCDYLVVGAGARGLAFVDTLLRERQGLTVALVDRHLQPGGHLANAYGFAELRQPVVACAAVCGNSSHHQQPEGLLAAARRRRCRRSAEAPVMAPPARAQLLEHFEGLLRFWQGTGRLRYIPGFEYREPGSLVPASGHGGAEISVAVLCKTVDATRLGLGAAPVGRRASGLEIAASGAQVALPRDLPGLWAASAAAPPPAAFAVLGAGQAGVEAVLHLLDHGVPAARISWVVPGDPWLCDREIFAGAHGAGAGLAEVLKTFAREAAASYSVRELYLRLECEGYLMRFDKKVLPSRNRCLTVSREELQRLRSVLPGVLRKGRVTAVHARELLFESGERVPLPSGTLVVDCTGHGGKIRSPTPVFQGDKIVVQAVSFCQEAFSAALFAHLEARHPQEEDWKNGLCQPVPRPRMPEDLLRGVAISIRNSQQWCSLALLPWLSSSPMSAFSYRHLSLRKLAFRRPSRAAAETLQALESVLALEEGGVARRCTPSTGSARSIPSKLSPRSRKPRVNEVLLLRHRQAQCGGTSTQPMHALLPRQRARPRKCPRWSGLRAWSSQQCSRLRLAGPKVTTEPDPPEGRRLTEVYMLENYKKRQTTPPCMGFLGSAARLLVSVLHARYPTARG